MKYPAKNGTWLVLGVLLMSLSGASNGAWAKSTHIRARAKAHVKLGKSRKKVRAKTLRSKAKSISKTAAAVNPAPGHPLFGLYSEPNYQLAYDGLIEREENQFHVMNPRVFFEGEWHGIAAGTAFADDIKHTSDVDAVCKRLGFSGSLSFEFSASDCGARKEVVIDERSWISYLRRPKCSRGTGVDHNTWVYSDIVCENRAT